MKWNKTMASIAAAAMLLVSLGGCSQGGNSNSIASDQSSSLNSSTPSSSSTIQISPLPEQTEPMKIAVMTGPTGMGMVQLMDRSDKKESALNYEFTIEGTADAIVGKLAKGELDAAAVPANLASVLYQKLEGKIAVAAINTLGVLYVVENGDTVQSVADLKGKTIYSMGKGTTPEFALNYVLKQNGIDPEKDVTIEYKTEATEVAALMGEKEGAVAVLPQPYVTIAQTKNENMREALSLSEEWDKVQGENKSSMITGVLIVRKEYLESNPEIFEKFMDEYKESVEFITTNVNEGAIFVAKYEIAPEPIAKLAIPKCNITFIEGADMKEKLTGYLTVLHEANPASVGGKLPDDGFYYAGNE